MSQVKSSSHSPHCIEHSPYPPCVPTCRLQKELEQFLAAEMAKPLSKGDQIGTTDGTCIQQRFGALPKEPFQPLGHGPNIISMDNISPDPIYEGLFKDPGTLSTGPHFERNPYLSTNPNACVNHEMAWHWKSIPCELFEAGLDDAVGFFDETDDAAVEARRFRIGRDAEVQKIAAERSRAQRTADTWRNTAYGSITLGVAGLLISIGRAWWGW